MTRRYSIVGKNDMFKAYSKGLSDQIEAPKTESQDAKMHTRPQSKVTIAIQTSKKD